MKHSINQQTIASGQTANGTTKTMKVKSALALLTLISFAAPSLVRADCVPNVAAMAAGTIVPFSVVTLTNFNSGIQHAGYATGTLTPATAAYVGPFLKTVGTPDMLFSDRTFSLPCPDPASGGFCLAPQQPFSVYSPDNATLAIIDNHAAPGAPSVLEVVLSSQSLGQVVSKATCDAASGELYFPTSAGMNIISFGTPIAPAH